jgi:hypothetical protein
MARLAHNKCSVCGGKGAMVKRIGNERWGRRFCKKCWSKWNRYNPKPDLIKYTFQKRKKKTISIGKIRYTAPNDAVDAL